MAEKARIRGAAEAALNANDAYIDLQMVPDHLQLKDDIPMDLLTLVDAFRAQVKDVLAKTARLLPAARRVEITPNARTMATLRVLAEELGAKAYTLETKLRAIDRCAQRLGATDKINIADTKTALIKIQTTAFKAAHQLFL